MVALGSYFIVLTVYAFWCHKRGTLFQKRWLLWTFVFSVGGPFIANQLGWVVAEVGRQPWIVYNLLRTADAGSRSVTASQVLGSIIMFGVIYALLFAVWIFLLNDKIRKGPEPVSMPESASFADALAVASRHAGHADSLTE
jgi:cytochrome d ubiquinol oxidase subunit I